MRYKRRRINKKRLSISLFILIILLILTTKISLKYAAENFNKDENTVEEPPILEKKEEENLEKEELEDTPIINEPDIWKIKNEEKKENIKVKTKADESQKTENIQNSSEYNELFKKDLFIGDSITDSLSFYKLIDEDNVIAQLGFTTKKSQEEIDKIISKNPENIYLLFGMNDILTFRDEEKFIMHYKELIGEISNKLPNANIYVQSILPVSSEVKAKKPILTNENIDVFNQALMDMTGEENIKYLNIRGIVENNVALFEPDGIHLKYKFYELWLEYLIDNTK